MLRMLQGVRGKEAQSAVLGANYLMGSSKYMPRCVLRNKIRRKIPSSGRWGRVLAS